MSQTFSYRFREQESLDGFREYLSQVDPEEILVDFETHLRSTYGGHYDQRTDGKQTIEIVRDLGFLKGFCGANIYKYLDRFGNKDGMNPVDIYKIMHYCVFLLWALGDQNARLEAYGRDSQELLDDQRIAEDRTG